MTGVFWYDRRRTDQQRHRRGRGSHPDRAAVRRLAARVVLMDGAEFLFWLVVGIVAGWYILRGEV